jgi:UDP-2,3-diacylglucosamine pyrophosphatase LpxH
MFDKSFLPEALFEFVVISDLHFFDVDPNKNVEFLSRRKQTERALHALRMASSLQPKFIIHLGDLIQQYPESVGFQNAMLSILKRLESLNVKFYHVAGNHDVGDKPDPTMPTHFVTSEGLKWYHNHLGPSWYSFDSNNCYFVILNSQIMNTDLKEAKFQEKWLEKDLHDNKNKRIFIFMHLPPYLWNKEEQGLGNYDNLDEPARSWLLNLIEENHIEMLVAGHVHFSFLDIIGKKSKYLLLSSPTFTRGDFSNIFKGEAPPEAGRDDAKKLGFYLFRVFKNRTEVHFIRTEDYPDLTQGNLHTRYLLTQSSASLSNYSLGLSLERPLTSFSDIPSSWPSVISRRIRNDYPLLSSLEMGVKSIKLPLKDLSNQLQNKKISYIRSEGVKLLASVIWENNLALREKIKPYSDQIDGLMVQTMGNPFPSTTCLREIESIQINFSIPTTLSCIIPGEIIENKQHPRTRFGYKLAELIQLNQELVKNNCKIDSVLCRMNTIESPWNTVKKAEQFSSLSHINSLTFNLELNSLNDLNNANLVAEALFSSILFSRPIFFQPLIDIDRAMDVTHGLLDNLCNPRPAFKILKNLNAILNSDFKNNSDFKELSIVEDNLQIISVSLEDKQLALIIPNEKQVLSENLLNESLKSNYQYKQITVYHLMTGYVNYFDNYKGLQQYLNTHELNEPALIIAIK